MTLSLLAQMSSPTRSLLEFFELGGIVMWFLLGYAIIGLLVFMERLLYFHRSRVEPAAFLDGIKNILRKDRLVEALTVCEETSAPIAGIIKAGLTNHTETPPVIEAAMEEAARVEIPFLQRRLDTLAAIGQTAPILGLLGTLLGMIELFLNFELQGAYATAGELAGGFWQALLTSAFGLGIGVVALVSHHFLTARVKVLVHDMEWVAHQLLLFLRRERETKAVASIPGIETGGTPTP